MDKVSRTPLGHRATRQLRVADTHLARVLDGEAYLLFDGAMGTQLQARGLAAGEIPELLCLTNPAEITEIHAAYVAAGAEAVTTNTFGANAAKLGDAASVGASIVRNKAGEATVSVPAGYTFYIIQQTR